MASHKISLSSFSFVLFLFLSIDIYVTTSAARDLLGLGNDDKGYYDRSSHHDDNSYSSGRDNGSKYGGYDHKGGNGYERDGSWNYRSPGWSSSEYGNKGDSWWSHGESYENGGREHYGQWNWNEHGNGYGKNDRDGNDHGSVGSYGSSGYGHKDEYGRRDYSSREYGDGGKHAKITMENMEVTIIIVLKDQTMVAMITEEMIGMEEVATTNMTTARRKHMHLEKHLINIAIYTDTPIVI